MKFWLDTEFIEAGDRQPIHLISLGAVSESGAEFYLQNANAPLEKANEWVRRNVLPQLSPCPLGLKPRQHAIGPCVAPGCAWKPKHVIAARFKEWVGLLSKPDGFEWVKPEFWGYYADYDWVVIAQMYGAMVELPKGWPMYCRDIKQWCDDLGNPVLPAQAEGEHNALADARWNKTAWYFLADKDVMRLCDINSRKAGQLSVESMKLRGTLDARQRNESEVSARQIDQEPGVVSANAN